MTAILKKMDTPKFSRNGKVCFRRLYFELEDGNWAATDLVPSFRNYKWWEPVVKSGIGTEIGGVFLKDGYRDKINADSEVYILQEPLVKRPDPVDDLNGKTLYFPSFTKPNDGYQAKYVNGVLVCPCPDFTYRKKYRMGKGGCKHIKRHEKEQAELKRKAREALPKLF